MPDDRFAETCVIIDKLELLLLVVFACRSACRSFVILLRVFLGFPDSPPTKGHTFLLENECDKSRKTWARVRRASGRSVSDVVLSNSCKSISNTTTPSAQHEGLLLFFAVGRAANHRK